MVIEMTKQIEQASKVNVQLTKSIEKVEKKEEDFKKKNISLGTHLVSVKDKVVELSKEYINLDNAMFLLTEGINQASEIEQYRKNLNSVMKDTEKAGETMQWAVNFANRTPFEIDDIMQAATNLEEYGLEAKKVLPMIGDMAGETGTDIMESLNAVTDAQEGNLEGLEKFGIDRQKIIDQANKMMTGKEVFNNKGEIIDIESFNTALMELIKQNFEGGIEKQANTFQGIMDTIKGVFSTTLAQMVGVGKDGEIKIGSVFDTVKEKLKMVLDTLIQWSNDGTIDALVDKISGGLTMAAKVGGTAFDLLSNSIKWVVENMNWLVPIITGIVAGLKAFQIINTVIKLMTLWRDVTLMHVSIQSILNTVLLANPIGLVAAGIGILIAAGTALYLNWDTIVEKATLLWTIITDTWEKIKILTLGTWETIKTTVIETFDNVLEKISDCKEKILELWENIKVILQNPIEGSIKLIEKSINVEEPTKNAWGIHRVPRDNYAAVLHEGERVLTKREVNQIDNMGNKGNYITVNINGMNKSTNEIINELVPKLKCAVGNS